MKFIIPFVCFKPVYESSKKSWISTGTEINLSKISDWDWENNRFFEKLETGTETKKFPRTKVSFRGLFLYKGPN